MKDTRKQPSFVSFRKDVFLHSPAYKSLSGRAKALLVDLTMQFNGWNNGEFTTAFKYMHERGWRSRDTLGRARGELLDKGFIELTRQGGLGFASLYAVTWWPIHGRNGQLDVGETKTPRNWWRDGRPPDGDNSK